MRPDTTRRTSRLVRAFPAGRCQAPARNPVQARHRQRPQRRQDRPSRRSESQPRLVLAKHRAAAFACRSDDREEQLPTSISRQRCRTSPGTIWASIGSRASRCWRFCRRTAFQRDGLERMTDIDRLERRISQIRPGRKGAHLSARRAAEATQFDEDYEIATLDFEPFLHGGAADKGALRKGVRRRARGDRFRGPRRPRRRSCALRRNRRGNRSILFRSTPLAREDALPG